MARPRQEAELLAEERRVGPHGFPVERLHLVPAGRWSEQCVRHGLLRLLPGLPHTPSIDEVADVARQRVLRVHRQEVGESRIAHLESQSEGLEERVAIVSALVGTTVVRGHILPL